MPEAYRCASTPLHAPQPMSSLPKSLRCRGSHWGLVSRASEWQRIGNFKAIDVNSKRVSTYNHAKLLHSLRKVGGLEVLNSEITSTRTPFITEHNMAYDESGLQSYILVSPDNKTFQLLHKDADSVVTQ